jgi:hypothetical protein
MEVEAAVETAVMVTMNNENSWKMMKPVENGMESGRR